MKKILIYLTFTVALSTSAFAGDDPLYPSDGSTLFIDRSTRPNPLQQEVDPSYAFHAKAARKRLEKALYYLLLARQEYLLYRNHMRTLDIGTSKTDMDAINKAIIALDETYNPPIKTNPLSTVVTNMPSPSIVVDKDSRSLIVSEPTRPLDDLRNMYDGLSSPEQRMGNKITEYEAAPVADIPQVPIYTNSDDTPTTQSTRNATETNYLSMPLIPKYQPETDATCSTCGDGGTPIQIVE